MQKRERNKSSSKVEQIFCNICKRNTNHKILYSLKKTSSDDFNDGSFFRCESWHEVLECLGCECISFRQKVSSTDDYDKTGNLNIVSLFPRRDENLLNPKYFFAAPAILQRIYRETMDCYNNENLILCAAGVRALVEGVCNENLKYLVPIINSPQP